MNETNSKFHNLGRIIKLHNSLAFLNRIFFPLLSTNFCEIPLMLKLQLLLRGFNIYSWPCKHIIEVVYLYKEIGGVGKL